MFIKDKFNYFYPASHHIYNFEKTSSIEGHAEAVISANFSPCGKHLASGSGDTTVRFWDLNTQTPLYRCEGIHIENFKVCNFVHFQTDSLIF